MKKYIGVLIAVVLVLGACDFFMGPEVSSGNGEGNLIINLGGNPGPALGVTSAAELPSGMINAMRYELTLTGPNGETLKERVGVGENLIKLTVVLGTWQIDAKAFYHEEASNEDVLAGTGSLTVPVIPGLNEFTIPMFISEGYFSIAIDSSISNGTITANFDAAFPGTTITLTATPDPGYTLKRGSLRCIYLDEANNDQSVPISAVPPYTFTMPAGDVTVYAEFAGPVVRYVKSGGTGGGSSWASASNDLQAMIDELAASKAEGAAGPFVVEVGAGTYKPQYKPNSDGTTNYETPANDRDSVFILREGVEVLGGYPSIGGDESSRDSTTNVTILSGDIDGDSSLSGNAYHVVLGVDIPADSGTVLDGFTIKGGNADGTGSIAVGTVIQIYRNNGGGMGSYNSSPALTNVTISGNYANGGGGMYNNNSSSPVLINVIISGNSANGSTGGGMSNNSSSPVLTNVTISGNSSGSHGGGMFNFSSSPVLTNVTISDNDASGGGGMHNSNSSSPVLTDVTILGNSAGASDNGGGMYNDSSSPVLTNVTISGNSARLGGGMYNNSSSSLVLTNVTISGNSANGSSGGGMYNVNSSPVLTNVTISGNSSGGLGGGISNFSSSSPQIRNSIIWGNVATQNEPGIYNNPDSSSIPVISYSIVEGYGWSGVWNGPAGSDGGNNRYGDPDFVEWINPSQAGWSAAEEGLTGNYALKAGSLAINAGNDDDYPDDADAIETLAGITLSAEAKAAINDVLTPAPGKDLGDIARIAGEKIDMGAYENSGGVSATSYTVYVRAGLEGTGTSWSNASGDLQKMMDMAHEAQKISGITTAVVRVGAGTYIPQYAPGPDGESIAEADLGSLTSRDKTFILREGVEVLGGYPSMGGDSRDSTTNITILSGDIDGDNLLSGNAYHVVLGVGIPADSGTVLDGLTIKGGNADGTGYITVDTTTHYQNSGGGIFNSSSSPVLTHVTISDNSASANGGGMYNDYSSPALADVTISDNTTSSGGGGMFNWVSSPTLTDVTISGNSSNSEGGGMSNFNSSSPALTDVTISGNDADLGGGMYNSGSSSPALYNVTIEANHATSNGGGMYNSDNSSPVLTYVSISVNSSGGSSGGMYNSESSSPVLTHVSISGNSASANGGGMYNNSSSSPVLTNVTISGNSSSAEGGGIYNYSSSPVLTNVTISGNSSSAEGGGMANIGSSPVLTNVTISGNSAGIYGGGGMYNASSSLPLIRNSIIWGNTAASDPGISNYGGGSTVISFSIVEGSGGSGSWVAATGTDGGNNLDVETGEANSPFDTWVDPSGGSWTATDSGDYRLVASSPAIDAGNNDDYPDNADDTSVFPSGLSDTAKAAINAVLTPAPGKDSGGQTRIQGSAIDMGAYEAEAILDPQPQ